MYTIISIGPKYFEIFKKRDHILTYTHMILRIIYTICELYFLKLKKKKHFFILFY